MFDVIFTTWYVVSAHLSSNRFTFLTNVTAAESKSLFEQK